MQPQQKYTSVQKITIPSSHSSQRLDNFLITFLKGVPKTHIYKIIRSGQVRCNSKRMQARAPVVAGDIIRIPPIHSLQKKNIHVAEGLKKLLLQAVIYEDNDLVIINKPNTLAVHAGSNNSLGIIDILRSIYNSQLELIHRLDKSTSGCLMVAKNAAIAKDFHAMLRNREMTKTYVLCVEGHVSPDINTVETYIDKNITSNGERIMSVSNESKLSAKLAITNFSLTKYIGSNSLLKAQPITGRTHQIRVHAAHIGHAILGDAKYGDYKLNNKLIAQGINRLLLHAAAISFVHPISKQKITVTAPLEQKFISAIKKLENNVL